MVLFLSLAAGLVYANLTLKGGGDFYVHWAAARGFVVDKLDPYGAEVPARVQQLVYGGRAQAGDEPYILDTPFQLLLLYFPFSFISDPRLARALFTLILELSLFGLSVQSLRLTDWEVPRGFAVLFIFCAVFNPYSYQAIHEASPVLLLGFLYAEILFALRMDMDELAGALMAVSLYYWEAGAPFLILICLRVLYEKRMGVFSGFLMLSAVLLFISFVGYPNWIMPFLRAVSNNLRAGFGFSTHTAFTHLLPAYGGTIAWILVILLIVVLGIEWGMARTGEPRRFYWAACLSLAAAPLLGFRTEMEHLSLMVIPLALVFSIIYERWRRFGAGMSYVLLLLVLSVPWLVLIFASDLLGAAARDVVFLFFPLTTLTGLYWVRWWAIRPPRIWTDLAPRP